MQLLRPEVYKMKRRTGYLTEYLNSVNTLPAEGLGWAGELAYHSYTDTGRVNREIRLLSDLFKI